MVEISLTLSILISLVIAALITLFQYGKFKRKGGIYLWMAILRFLALFCVILLLFNPKIRNSTIYTEKPGLTILVDNSSSIADLGYDSISKDALEQLIQDKALQQRFDIETLAFDSQLKPIDSLDYNAGQTNLFNALKLSSQPNLANHKAIVLLSDGNQTIGKDFMYALEQDSTAYVYPIVMGDSTTALDFNIGRINANKYVYLNNIYPVEVFVNYQANEPAQTKVGIYEGDRLLKSKAVNFDGNQSIQLVNFEIEATKTGLHSLNVTVQAHPLEKNTLNNSKSFAIEVIDQKSRIAILSTVVHPDLGALKNTIESNAFRQVQMFDPTKDEVNLEEFELFILYQPNDQFKTIINRLEQEERNYWLIGGADTQWEFLNSLELGFLKNSQYQLEEIFPLENTGFNMFGVGEMNFENIPPLTHQMGSLDLIATPEILLYQQVAGVETMEPLLMVFENNNRKSAILAAEGIWRWRASSYLNTDSNIQFDSYIGNLIQYLSSSKVRKRLEVTHELYYYENAEIIVRADYYDKNYRLQPNGKLSIVLSDVNSDLLVEFPMVNKGGHYEVDLGGLAPSVYDYTVSVASQALTETGRLQILPFEVEKQFVNPNIKKLNQLANKYQGSLYFPDQIDELKSHLSSSKSYLPVQKITQNIVPLIHWKWLLAMAILFLSGEWFLRKYNGLI